MWTNFFHKFKPDAPSENTSGEGVRVSRLREEFHPEAELSEPQADTPLPADSHVQAWGGAAEVFRRGSRGPRPTIITGSCCWPDERSGVGGDGGQGLRSWFVAWKPEINIWEVRRPKLHVQVASRERCRVGGVAHESIHTDGGEGSWAAVAEG